MKKKLRNPWESYGRKKRKTEERNHEKIEAINEERKKVKKEID